MTGEYKRPTKILDLPSGKKVEIITYFSKYETEKLSSLMLVGQKIKGEELAGLKEDKDSFGKMEFELEKLSIADSMAREMAIRKLIDIGGQEYEATIEAIRDFLDETDGTIVTQAINEMSKKKQIGAK